MTQETKKKLHCLYGIVVSIAAVLAGICLIAACLNIYQTGIATDAGQIYTRQIVAESFAKIAVPVYACLVLVVGGMVLDLALPVEKKKQKPEKNLPLILQKLREKTDLDACDESLRSAITKEQKRRNILMWAATFPLAFGFVKFCEYASEPAHWAANSTPSMVHAMGIMGCWLLIPFFVAVLAMYGHRSSMKKEIELMRQAAAQAPKAVEKVAPKTRGNKAANIVRIVIVAVGALLVILGACNEGTADILTKAVNICTECVGLG